MEMNYDERTLHKLEDELHTKIYPGTEIMSDVGKHHFVKGGSNQVLVPQPSHDPHDPLNWSRKWKTSTVILSTLVSFAQGMGPLSLAPMFPALMEDYHHSLADVVEFTGVCILVLGFSNFIWAPIQTTFGRRPVVIVSCTICLFANIWRACADSYGGQMGACILNGIGAGPAETSQPAVIADIFFLHERGAWNTLYFTFYFGSLMIGPIIAGAMTQHSGWRSFWWFNVALFGVILILLVFLFPETKWHRAHPDELQGQKISGSLQSSTTTSSLHESDSEKEKERDPEKDLDKKHVEPLPNVTRIPTVDVDEAQGYLHRGGPARSQFKFWVWPKENPLREMAYAFWVPWKIFVYPIVQLASFLVSWPASVFLVVNLTQAQNFAAPPYNWSSQSVGFTNFAMLIGAFIGLATNGPLSDWIANRSTRKNKGIREPEMRLPALIPYVIIMLVGNFIVAFGQQYKWDWKVIVIIGYTCAGIQVSAIPSIAATYAVDSYKPIAGSIFVAITVNKNVYGYGLSKYLTPWVERQGYVPPIMTNMCLGFLWCSCAIIFYFYGKTFRKWTANSSVHKM